jgi:hypothetical protein
MLIKVHERKDKILKELGAKPSGLLIGEIRQALGEDLGKVLRNVVEHTFKKGYKEYYILVSCRNYGRDIKTTVMIYDHLPPRLLGTICYYINNETGDAERLWVLPMDFPIPDEVRSNEYAPQVGEDGKRMPILY